MSFDLGDVSAYGEARRRNPAWGRVQDEKALRAKVFFMKALPKGVTLERERVSGGTKFLATRGTASGSPAVFDDFRRLFGARGTSHRALHGDRDEYFLAYADPREAWRAARGRAAIGLCFFVAVASLGLVLLLSPRVLLDAIE